MILLYAATLLYLSVAQHGYDLPHNVHLENFSARHHIGQLTMGDQSSHTHGLLLDPGATLDPGVTLGHADVVKFLLKDTSTQIAELWKDVKNELDLDRIHNKEVNKQILDGLGKRIDILEKYLVSSLQHKSLTHSPESSHDQPLFACSQFS